jgi:hypothetical protein
MVLDVVLHAALHVLLTSCTPNFLTAVRVQDCSTRTECPSSPLPYKIGSKRRHPEHRTCPCKRPILDFSKMCEVSEFRVETCYIFYNSSHCLSREISLLTSLQCIVSQTHEIFPNRFILYSCFNI